MPSTAPGRDLSDALDAARDLDPGCDLNDFELVGRDVGVLGLASSPSDDLEARSSDKRNWVCTQIIQIELIKAK